MKTSTSTLALAVLLGGACACACAAADDTQRLIPWPSLGGKPHPDEAALATADWTTLARQSLAPRAVQSLNRDRTFNYFPAEQLDPAPVAPEGTAALGGLTWDRPRGGEVLWQIGTPDRSAAEFGFAEDFRRWGLWDAIAAAHPNGATFVAGKSRDRDWPFQMAVSQNRDLSWHAPAWRVEFDVPAARTGTAVLTLGVAAYEGKAGPQLRVALNGAAVGAVNDLAVSGAAHRSGVHAGYQERRLTFDAAKLKAGRNVLTFEMPPPARAAEKRLGAPAAVLLWDCLRLDVEPGPRPAPPR